MVDYFKLTSISKDFTTIDSRRPLRSQLNRNLFATPNTKVVNYLNEPTIADAILDRIIPKAHRIDLKGKSRRKNLN